MKFMDKWEGGGDVGAEGSRDIMGYRKMRYSLNTISHFLEFFN